MLKIQAKPIETTDFAAVEEKLADLQDSPLAAQLQAVVRQLRRGADVTVYAEDKQLTPNQAAELLQISRPVVMSLIRRGELTANIVGERNHRIPMSEISDFMERRDRASRDVAAAFARAGSAKDELVVRASGVSPEDAAALGF